MIVKYDGGAVLTLVREPSDPKFYGVKNASGESHLLHYLKVHLNQRGFCLIKKRMWKDGHLGDDMQQYLRAQSQGRQYPHVAIWNDRWAIEGAEHDWNTYNRTRLCIIFDIFGVQPDCRERFTLLMNTLPKEN